MADARASDEQNVRSGRILGIAIATLVILLVAAIAAVVVMWPQRVPDVVGKPLSDAEASLSDAGFKIGAQSQLATNSAGAGRVIAQGPRAGELVRRNSSIDLTIAAQPSMKQVPDVVGLDETDAVQQLGSALYIPVTIGVFEAQARRGEVLWQLPSGGRDWETGRPVGIGACLGPDDGTGVEVPDLVGLSPMQVDEELADAPFDSRAAVVDPRETSASVVVTQAPAPGVKVRSRATILLLFDLP